MRNYSATGNSARNRLRRTVHFVPADNDKFLSKCLGLGADSLVLDLEDSVVESQKGVGREKVERFLENNKGGSHSSEILVRINPLETEHWKKDLAAGMGADGFVLPKIEHPDQIGEVAAEIQKLGGGEGGS